MDGETHGKEHAASLSTPVASPARACSRLQSCSLDTLPTCRFLLIRNEVSRRQMRIVQLQARAHDGQGSAPRVSKHCTYHSSAFTPIARWDFGSTQKVQWKHIVVSHVSTCVFESTTAIKLYLTSQEHLGIQHVLRNGTLADGSILGHGRVRVDLLLVVLQPSGASEADRPTRGRRRGRWHP
ncbi:hypothetical protein KC356_g171 [Hortaea werneckii]|nr:hypothetical protein KC356_g171 [Hortaea werneckii]